MRKEINFCKRLGVPVIGVVENMSAFVCPHCQVCSTLYPGFLFGLFLGFLYLSFISELSIWAFSGLFISGLYIWASLSCCQVGSTLYDVLLLGGFLF